MIINMKRIINSASISILALGLFLLCSCTNKPTKTTESEVVIMDSISNDLQNTTRDLEEKNAKLEAALEKVDNE